MSTLPANPVEELVVVRLLGLPLPLHERAQQQGEAMRREFQLIVEQDREERASVPARLLALSSTLSARYEGLTDEQEQRIEAGLAAGEEQLAELAFIVPAQAGQAAEQLAVVLDEADEFCRQGRLLTLEASPDLQRYRRWYLDNFSAQCAGGAPQPWTGPAR